MFGVRGVLGVRAVRFAPVRAFRVVRGSLTDRVFRVVRGSPTDRVFRVVRRSLIDRVVRVVRGSLTDRVFHVVRGSLTDRVFRVVRGIVVGVILLLFTTPAAAQLPPAAAYVDRPVASATLEIEGRASTDPGLLEAVQTRTGAPLKMADVRETITHLYNLGRFEDVRVEAEAAPGGGVALRYVLSPIHTVTRVVFQGTPGLSEGTLRSRMIERFDNPDRATLVFDVNAGPRTIIAHSTIAGHPLEPAAAIEARLQILPGQPYEPAELATRLADYKSWMRHRRYYEASATAQPPVFDEDRTRADVTVDVEPGPLVTVELTGDPLPKDRISELVPIEREGSVDQDLLEDSALRIKDFLNQEGYWKVEVSPPERKEAEGRLTIVFHVTRGQLYHVAPGGIDVSGNRSISIEELRPLLRMSQGEVFVRSKLDATIAAITQLYKTRGFAAVQVDSDTAETGAGLVKPVIVIKEGPRVVVAAVTLTGNKAIPTERLMALLTLQVGAPYYGPVVARDRDALLVYYLNAGYASADVTVPPVVPVTTPDGARATVVFKIVEGPQTIVEHIFITGNLRTKPSIIQRELRLTAGGPLGLEDLTESRRRLSALGLFRRIQISAVSHGDPSLRDVIITVEEAIVPRTSIRGSVSGRPAIRRTAVSSASPNIASSAPTVSRGRSGTMATWLPRPRWSRGCGPVSTSAGRDSTRSSPIAWRRPFAAARATRSARPVSSISTRRCPTRTSSPSTACSRRSGCRRFPPRSRAIRATICWSRRQARS